MLDDEIKPSPKSKIMVFLLDTSMDFLNPQAELLMLALRLQEQGFNPHIFCPTSSTLMQKAEEHGLFVQSISNGTKPSFAGLWRIFWKQKNNVPLCIHTFTENCLPLAKRIAARRKNNSTILLHSCFDAPNQTKTLAKYWDVPQKIVYPSKYMANVWAKAGINPDKVCIIHTVSEDLAPYVAQKSKRWIFIATEKLEQNSGIDFLLKAMSALWQHPYLPEWEVRVVGSGPLLEKLLDEAKALGVESRLALLGDQNMTDVMPYAHALVCPHVEGQGNLSALMRAWNCGMPLICTMVNGHMEIANTNNALLTPEADPQRLAAAMIEFMCRPERVEQFIKSSASMGSYAKTTRLQNQYLKLYQDCIARRGWVLTT